MNVNNAGRTYHSADTPYALPDDERDRNRLDLWHTSLKAYFGANFRAPLENPTAILDLGTGSGIWAAEMAEQFPEATVLGIDISPVTSKNHPKNCSFNLVNLAKDWPFEPESFDVIHTRFVLVHLPNAKDIIERSISALKPGGFLLFDEACHWMADDETPIGPGTRQFYDLYGKHMAQRGVDAGIGPKMEQILQESSCFLAIDNYAFKCPMSAWTQDNALNGLGLALRRFLIAAYTSLKDSLAASGITQEVIDGHVDEMNADDKKVYMPLYWLWAKKKL